MKLIGNELGRVVMLAHAEEWRPSHGIPLAAAVAAIQERYDFVIRPILSAEAIAEADRSGYKFERGTFHIDGTLVAINDFMIFRDGVSVTTHDTAYAEAVFEDFFEWGIEEFGLKPLITSPVRIFRSQLVVQFDRPLSSAFKHFEALAALTRNAMAPYFSHDVPVNVTRLDLGMDPMQTPGVIKPSPLVLERRVSHPHNSEVYFSDAPLPSRTHFDTLQQFESGFA